MSSMGAKNDVISRRSWGVTEDGKDGGESGDNRVFGGGGILGVDGDGGVGGDDCVVSY